MNGTWQALQYTEQPEVTPNVAHQKKTQKDIIHVPSRELTWGKGTSSSKVTFDGICGRSQEGTSI